MTSNLASEKIAEHGMELRNAAHNAAEKKLSEKIGKQVTFALSIKLFTFKCTDDLHF